MVTQENKRDAVPVCSVHDKFQTAHGRWLRKDEGYTEHLAFACVENVCELESPCDECEDPRQLEIVFEEVKTK